MRYLTIIQHQFLKEARRWDDLSYDEQRGYLKRHPKSKRRLTARPEGAAPRRQQQIEQKAFPHSETPKLDKKLGEVFEVYSSIGTSRYDEDSDEAKRFNKIWQKEFPSESKIDIGSILYDVERDTGLLKDIDEKRPKRSRPLSREEFIQAAKDVLLSNEKRLPKVEGEEDPSQKEMKTYGLSEPLTSTESATLKKIEKTLPEDQKQFAKYLIPSSRRSDEKLTVEDASGERPIIKSEFDHLNFGHMTHYLVPTSTKFSTTRSDFGAGGLDFASFETVGEARDFIKKALELERKANLRQEVEKIQDNLRNNYKKIEERISGLYSAEDVADLLAKYPREDQYTTQMDAKGNVTGKYVNKHGRKFNLSPEQHAKIAIAIGNITNLSPEDLQSVIKDFDLFVKDLEENKDLMRQFEQEKANAIVKHKDKFIAMFKDAIPKIQLRNKLRDQHGYEKTKEDLKLPAGFKFKDKATIGEQFDKDEIVIGDNDNTMEIVMSLGKPGGHGRYDGEVYYKVPGDETSGYYSVGRRGIDSGLNVDWTDERLFADVVKDVAQDVKERQDRLSKSIDVPLLGGRSWKITPENIEKIKVELQSGKSHTFAPHGMGIAYGVSKKPERHAMRVSPEAEKIFGISPLYATQIDWD